MKPKLLLLSPLTWYRSVLLPGLGNLCVGAMVRDDVELHHHDANVHTFSLKRWIHEVQVRPDIVAIQCQNTNRIYNVLTMCDAMRRQWPGVKIVSGGTHASLDAEFLVKTGLVDYVVVGEGELSFQELIRRMVGKTETPYDQIKGICYLKEGEPHRTEPRPFIENLDDLPLPAWDVVNLSDYQDNSPFGTMTLIETSRGCAFGCTFCSPALLWKRTWRKKTPARVALEFRMAEERGFEFTWLAELDPCHDPEHIRGFCTALVEQGNTIRWFSQQRADQITAHPDLVPLMYAAGCRVANVGYESMSLRTLRSFNKGTTPAMNEKARQILAENKIVTNGGLIIGVPGETEEEIESTIKFGRTLDFPDFAILRPYPQTRWGSDNEEHRDNYKKFNEGWCFLHENPKMVERKHKKATFLAWFHPKRIFAVFSSDDFRRGFCRWRYQVYAEVLFKRFYDIVKHRLHSWASVLPGVKGPEELAEGMEEYAFLPQAPPEESSAIANHDLVERALKRECGCAQDGKTDGGNGERRADGPREGDDERPQHQQAASDTVGKESTNPAA